MIKWGTMSVMMRMTDDGDEKMITDERNTRHDSPALFPSSHLRDLLKPKIIAKNEIVPVCVLTYECTE